MAWLRDATLESLAGIHSAREPQLCLNKIPYLKIFSSWAIYLSMRLTEKQAISQANERLAELLDTPVSEVRLGQRQAPEIDAVLTDGKHMYLVECKTVANAATITQAIAQLRHYTEALDTSAIPLLVVPFMGETGQHLCKEAGIAWLDLSGNARIAAPGLRILVAGQPNRFKYRGRPASAFAPKSSRIARWLLMHPDAPMSQREISQSVGVDEGLTSHVIARLRDQGLVSRDNDGLIRLQDFALLLDSWYETYDFSKHHCIRGHIAARTGDALLKRLVDVWTEHHQEYAATGLAAAWLMTRHAGFRLVTMYLRSKPPAALLEKIGFREDPAGANTWLVIPTDEGVFQGADNEEGIRCVHPIQAYLDLKAQPERAPEAASVLRKAILTQAHHA